MYIFLESYFFLSSSLIFLPLTSFLLFARVYSARSGRGPPPASHRRTRTGSSTPHRDHRRTDPGTGYASSPTQTPRPRCRTGAARGAAASLLRHPASSPNSPLQARALVPRFTSLLLLGMNCSTSFRPPRRSPRLGPAAGAGQAPLGVVARVASTPELPVCARCN
jgi:hypothetical protein